MKVQCYITPHLTKLPKGYRESVKTANPLQEGLHSLRRIRSDHIIHLKKLFDGYRKSSELRLALEVMLLKLPFALSLRVEAVPHKHPPFVVATLSRIFISCVCHAIQPTGSQKVPCE